MDSLPIPKFMSSSEEPEDNKKTEILNDPTPPETETPAKPGETPAATETPATPPVEPKPGETPAKTEEPKVEPKPGEKPAETTPPAKPEEKPKLILGKYKTMEDLEKAHLELTRTLTTLQEQTKANKPPKGNDLDIFLRTPVISAQIPQSKSYNLDNGSFDMDSYMRDYTKNLILGIQRGMLTGPLAAAQFSLLQGALSSEHDKTVKEIERENYATTLYNSLQDKYPILKTDKTLQDNFARSIQGEKVNRYNAGIKAGKKPEEIEDLKDEDYENLLTGLIGKPGEPPAVPPAPPDVTETLKGGPVIGGGAQIKTEIEQDIEGMMTRKKESIF